MLPIRHEPFPLESRLSPIIKVAQKIPDEALQEDEKLLLWYDQALTRMEAGG